jgi:hypothetical protein
MPVKIEPGTNPLGYLARDERAWRLQRVFAQDGLNPTQVVRYFEAPEGIDFAEASALPFKLDATANADDGTNTSNVTTDDRRYVVNPHVLKHQFDGLWTGGPARWGTDQQTQKRTVEQTLTRTWPAGHGYMVDADGNYVVVWKDATGNGFHRDGPNGTQIPVSSTDVCEYATAKAALMSHRPSLTSRFSPYMALREDIPGSYWREIVWRDFTHESIPFIEALKDSPADVRAIVEYHFGSRVAGDVQDLTTNVDKDTNTVYVKCSLLLRDLSEPPPEVDPADPEDVAEWLLTLPVIEAPCTRETLRIFGFDQFANGEGYKFTHVYRWPGLKDSARTRKALEFVCDKYVLPRLRAADYEADDPELDDAELDGTGRFFTTQEQAAASGQTAAATCRVPWWRIALQKLDEDKGEDGALAFTLVVTKPEWHGRDASGRDVHTSTNNPLGWGLTEHRMYPSLPRDAAQDAMEAISAPTHRLLSGLNQTEGSDGHSDVTWALRDLFEYSGTNARWKLPPNTQTVKGFTYPVVVFRVSRANADRKDATVTMPQVDPSKVAAAIEAGEAAFTANNLAVKKWEGRLNAEGEYVLTLSTDGYQGTGSGAYGATFTESATVTYSEIEKSYRKPAQAGLSDTPADGYYWRVVTYTAEIGRTSGGATDAAAHCSGGKAGSKIWPERQNDVDSIGSVWAWKKVTAISPGAWQAGVLQQ